MVSTIQKELISQKTLKASKTLNHFRTLNSSKALNPLLLELWVFKLFFEYQKAQYTVINDKKNIHIPNILVIKKMNLPKTFNVLADNFYLNL